MTGILSLWLPILLSAVLVFIASSLIHTVLPWHKGDFAKLPDEDAVRSALRPLAIPPGDYHVPRPSGSDEMKSAAFAEKVKAGPNIMMTVLPNGPWSMGPQLAMWFVYNIVVSIFAAYVAGRALPPGSEYLSVFRLAGATAFASYTLALYQLSIWYRRSWSLTLKATFDGLIYALLTAGAFGWLWPR